MTSKNNVCFHDCLIFMCCGIFAIVAFVYFLLGDGDMRNKDFRFLICSLIIFVALFVFLIFLLLHWRYKDSKKYFDLTVENIEEKSLANEKSKITVDLGSVEIPPRYFSGNDCLSEIEIYTSSAKSPVIGRAAFLSAKKLKEIRIYGSNLHFPKDCFLGLSKSCFVQFEDTEAIRKFVNANYNYWGIKDFSKIMFDSDVEESLCILITKVDSEYKDYKRLKDGCEIFHKNAIYFENNVQNYMGAFYDILKKSDKEKCFVFWIGYDSEYKFCVSFWVGGPNKELLHKKLLEVVKAKKYKFEGEYNSFQNEGYWYTIRLSDFYTTGRKSETKRSKMLKEIHIDDSTAGDIVSKISEIVDFVRNEAKASKNAL